MADEDKDKIELIFGPAAEGFKQFQPIDPCA
jgi:hypothetical protein